LGLLYGKRGATNQSEQYYQKVVELAPKRSSAWVGLGNNAWARGEIRQALDFYLKALGADPTNHEANYNVALAYRQLGDQQRADDYFQRDRNLQQAIKPN
jgi:tetratricopeptide (TPR) repeat protein